MRPLALVSVLSIVVACGEVPTNLEGAVSEDSQLATSCVAADAPAFEQLLVMGENPPRVGADYALAPLVTATASGNPAPVYSSDPAHDHYFFLWANRCIYPAAGSEVVASNPNGCRPQVSGVPINTKPNPLDIYARVPTAAGGTAIVGRRYWSFFTNYKLANACTRMRLHAALGEVDQAIAIGRNQGFIDDVTGRNDVITEPDHDAIAARARMFTANYPQPPGFNPPASTAWPQIGDHFVVDKCIATDFSSVEVTGGVPLSQRVRGVYLDYEVQDGRSSTTTTRVIGQLESALRGVASRARATLGLVVFTNTLYSPWVKSSGLDDTNLRTILGLPGIVGLSITDYAPTRPRTTPLAIADDVRAGLQVQLDLIRGSTDVALTAEERRKIWLVYGFKNEELGDDETTRYRNKLVAARASRSFVDDSGLAGVIVWWAGDNLRVNLASAANQPCGGLNWEVFRCLAGDIDRCASL